MTTQSMSTASIHHGFASTASFTNENRFESTNPTSQDSNREDNDDDDDDHDAGTTRLQETTGAAGDSDINVVELYDKTPIDLAIGVEQNDEESSAAGLNDRTAKIHWKPAEDKLLLRTVEQHGARNWASIAKRLKTGRTGPSCCARWCRLAGPKAENESLLRTMTGPVMRSNETAYLAISKGKRLKWNKWTEEEDAQLRHLVAENGPKNWVFIASQMGTNRSDDSCCGRWMHYLAPSSSRVDEIDADGILVPSSKAHGNASNPRWTAEEDAKLVEIKKEFPNDSWADVGGKLDPPRTAGSCRARYVQHIHKQFPDTTPAPPRRRRSPTASALNGMLQSFDTENQGDDTIHNGNLDSLPSGDAINRSDSVASLDAIEKTTAQGPVLDPSLVPQSPSNQSLAVLFQDRTATANGTLTEAQDVGEQSATTPDSTQAGNTTENGTFDNESQALFGEIGHGLALSNQNSVPMSVDFGLSAVTEGEDRNLGIRPWTQTEEQQLVSLVAEFGRRGWQKIADQLGTNRTAASVSARWQRIVNSRKNDTNMSTSTHPNEGGSNKSSKGWTKEDDAELRRGVARHGRSSWSLIGAGMTRPRSEYAAASRWYEHLAKSSSDTNAQDIPSVGDAGSLTVAAKRRWTSEEDKELQQLVEQYGPMQWSTIGRLMSSARPGTSCRLRWFNYLDKESKLQNLSSTEGSTVSNAVLMNNFHPSGENPLDDILSPAQQSRFSAILGFLPVSAQLTDNQTLRVDSSADETPEGSIKATPRKRAQDFDV